MTKTITGENPNLIPALLKAGVVPDGCRRIIIDIAVNTPVKMYYECFGDERILAIDLPKLLKEVVKDGKKES